jgi:uncharacterized protein (DUF1684 family)
MSADPVDDPLSLLDWRRSVGDLYAEIRGAPDARGAWRLWREARGELFREHPQSPVPACQRSSYTGPDVYDYDPDWRLVATVEPTQRKGFELVTSHGEPMSFTRFGLARFTHHDIAMALELYWLGGYGGGLFLPFADRTSGGETYGAGRYLLDTVKGADLGHCQGGLVLDFNFAYQPSCSYDPRWLCPLAPPANRLPVAVRAGERLADGLAATARAV